MRKRARGPKEEPSVTINEVEPEMTPTKVDEPSTEEDRDARAAKGDKARVPVELWDHFLEEGLSLRTRALDWKRHLPAMRRFALRCWKCSIARSLRKWAKEVRTVEKRWFEQGELEAMDDCLRRLHACTFWEWTDGSALFFWNWPPEFRLIARIGIQPWLKKTVEKWTVAQTPRRMMSSKPR